MIVVIDTNTDTCYYAKFIYKAADLIGVHRVTLSRWLSGGNKTEKYRRYKVYLQPEKL